MPAITPTRLTKRDLVVRRGLEEAAFDYALPHEWVIAVHKYLTQNRYRYVYSYDQIIGGFIWIYDAQSKVFGRPYPLSITAHYLITRVLPQSLFGKQSIEEVMQYDSTRV